MTSITTENYFTRNTRCVMKKIMIASILGVIVSVMAQAEEPGLEQLRAAAEQGNPDAQMEMGTLYEFGYQRPKDEVTALAWYRTAAAQGHALAAKRRDLLEGRMTPEKIEVARKLFEQWAKKKRTP